MHRKFDHKAIETKWQQDWRDKSVYTTAENPDKPKCYVLDMFPYPSGDGLHVGHPKGYIATDIYSRFKRMTGHEVLHPMGWDAFGLPAENYAIKNKVHPRVAVDKNVARFKEQLAVLGFDYDWNREINTTDPEFYKWTQWIFIQLFKKGLAYESHEPINWCPGCQTGLANEDLEPDGTCERCDSVVEKRPMRQWVLKIREYADRMLEDLDTLEWPEHIKEAQRNWIGRSEGALIDFKLSVDETITVFTTRPDTLFGATYMVLAPEHDLVVKYQKSITNWVEVEAYIKAATNKKEMDRLDETKEKTGVKLEGITATNPANGEEIPVYIADYVLAGYGTGAIMAVPAHDERDYAFAKKFGIEIKPVITPGRISHAGALIKIKGKSGKYLMQRRELTKKTNPGKIGFFGGSVEGEESVIETLCRELEEELELKLDKSDINSSFVDFSPVTESYCWVAETNEIDISTLVMHEGEEMVELTLEEIIENKDVTPLAKQIISSFVTSADLFTDRGLLLNSGEFDGMNSEEAKKAITEKVGGRMTSTYKIKDWVFSRQRYWGEPFPVIHGDNGKVYMVAEEQLPVKLPEVEHYEPTGDGQSPLASIPDWVNVTGYLNEAGDFVVADEAPAGKELIQGKRETNTMPQWAGSSWYYLRYMDPHNDEALVAKDNEKFWSPVDVYVGGDHAVRHLIYARFWHKFLYDIDVVSTLEPFQRLEFLGFILAEDGRKMSKRWGNVINPDEIVELVGADTLRVYEMFMGPFENTIAWSQDGLAGARRFLERVFGLSEHVLDGDVDESPETIRQLHKTIEKVSEDIEQFKFNTAVSAMMIFINTAEKEGLSDDTYSAFLRLLAPFAPHLTEELWMKAGGLQLSSGSEQNETGQRDKHSDKFHSIHLEPFPTYDEQLAKDDTVTIGVQINGKVRGEITIEPDADEATAIAAVQSNQQLQEKLTGTTTKKVIYVPGRILNFIVLD